jgi:SET domain-containing protein
VRFGGRLGVCRTTHGMMIARGGRGGFRCGRGVLLAAVDDVAAAHQECANNAKRQGDDEDFNWTCHNTPNLDPGLSSRHSEFARSSTFLALSSAPQQSRGVPLQTESLEFKPSPIHGTGGFARCDLPAGARVIEYVGERIDKRESLARCERGEHFIFDLDDQWDLDGNVEWNLARFLNHSCSPNCDAEFIEERIWIVTTRPVACGEELTFNYGYDLEEYREHPCHCGAANCVGFIVAEEFFSGMPEREIRA